MKGKFMDKERFMDKGENGVFRRREETRRYFISTLMSKLNYSVVSYIVSIE